MLVVLGGAGMGKSVLLADTAQRRGPPGCGSWRSPGWSRRRIWRSQRLFRPVSADAAELPQRQGMAQRALGFATEPVARDQFLTGIAALTLLSDASKLSPVLVVVDDAHWVT